MTPLGDKLTGATSVRWLRERPFVADLLLACVLAGLAYIIALGFDSDLASSWITRPDGVIQWVLVAGSAWAVPFRRVAPVAAVAAGGMIQVVVWGIGLPDTFLSTAVLLYSAAVCRNVLARRAAEVVVGVLILYTLTGVIVDAAPMYTLPMVTLVSIASVALGMAGASRQGYVEQAGARTEELQRSRARDRDRALVEERARIARELHDVVAHGLSVIVVQASAARRILDRDPDGAESALQQIEKTGRTALNEMRHVLSAIRTDPAESWQPAPGLSALDELVAEMANTGLQVSVVDARAAQPDLTGQEGGSTAAPLPSTVDVTAYRIVQESLTNVLKHGGRGVKASVDIVRTQRSLDLRIVDDGLGGSIADQGGQGLRGMQERVEVFGGRFAAGPQKSGGFAVSVSLPLDDAGSAR